MKRPPKDCINCKFNIATCDWRPLDKRQIRKLNRTTDEYGNWSRYYCKNHKYAKCTKNLQGVMWKLIEKEVE